MKQLEQNNDTWIGNNLQYKYSIKNWDSSKWSTSLKIVEVTLFCYELTITSWLHDFSLFEHEDLVWIFNGLDPVGDRDHSFAMHDIIQRLLDFNFIGSVEGRGCFIKQKHIRIS